MNALNKSVNEVGLFLISYVGEQGEWKPPLDMWTQIRLRMRELWPTQDEVLQLIDSVKNVSDSRG
jgi:hypothetical protein